MASDEVNQAMELSVPLLVFNEVEAETIDAIVSRILPTGDEGDGAHEAEVVVYIDRTLAGHSRHLQAFYRDRLQELDVYCSAQFNQHFADLSEHQQDEVLGQLDTRKIALGELGEPPSGDTARGRQDQERPPASLRTFFDVIWEHTVQGMFCDPAYGGNRNALGWRMLGFPGAQWGYSSEQRAHGFDATTISIRTLADLQRERPWQAMPGLGGKVRNEGNAAST